MRDSKKTKDQLIEELEALRAQLKELQRTQLGPKEIDSTGLKQAEDKLRRAHQEWEGIFQAIGHPTVILDPNYTVMAVNRATVRATGRSEQELQGKKCHEIFHGTDHAPAGCPLAAMLESGHLETTEMEIQAFGGVFLVSCTPVTDDRGRLQKIIHIATDITARKQTEESLRGSE